MENSRSIEELTLKILRDGAVSTINLIEKISILRPKTTRQGVYRVLRKLRDEEKIVIHGKYVSLNLHWIKLMSEFFSIAQFHYSSKISDSDAFMNLEEKDKIIYFFKNLNTLDSFWSHAFHMFTEITNQKEPIFIYNPHAWFSYARKETELALIKALGEKKMQVLITIMHNDPLDLELKKQFKSDLLQYQISNQLLKGKDNYYFNIFGNFLIEVYIDKDIAKEIDWFYKRNKIFNKEAENELRTIVSKSGKNKLIISKNNRRAEKYKNTLSKNFFIKRRT